MGVSQYTGGHEMLIIVVIVVHEGLIKEDKLWRGRRGSGRMALDGMVKITKSLVLRS